MQKTRKTYYANGTDIGDAMIHHGIYYLNGAEATTQDWTGKPSDWSDIRKDCPDNSIALYAGVKSDYSAYDNLGFTATCTGGYKVYIDETLFGTYNSNEQCSITWSNYYATQGEAITTPSALTAHKIWIEPATSGNEITVFQMKRVASSGQELQGLLWCHFNLTNTIRITELFCLTYPYNCQQKLLKALTAKNNLVKCSSNYALASFANTSSLEYVPTLDNLYVGISCFYNSTKIKTIKLTNPFLGIEQYGFSRCTSLKELKISNPRYSSSGNFGYFLSDTMLKKFPDLDWSKVKNANDIWTDYNKQLNDGEPTIVDARAGNQITKLGIRNTNSLVGLRVSNEAPFNYATAPQINVSYTGLDRQALVQLFNDLPYNVGYEVVGSPTITDGVVSGFSADDYTKTSLSIIPKDISESQFKIYIDETSLGDNQNFYLFQQKTNLQIYFNKYMSNGTNLTVYTGGISHTTAQRIIPMNTWIIIKTTYDGTTYKVYLTNNGTTTEILSFDVDLSYQDTERVGLFGRNEYNTGQYFRGSIDFNNTYIKVNGVTWFNGKAAMTKTLSCVGATGNQLITVGSPTIVDGVAIGFSNGNYVKTNNVFSPSDKSWEVICDLTTGADVTTNQGILTGLGNTNSTAPLYLQNGSLSLFLSSNGSSWDIAQNLSIIQLSVNTNYKIKVVYDTTDYKAYSFENNEWVLKRTISNSSAIYGSIPLVFGNNRGNGQGFLGSINLNNTYIKVNGEYWYKTDVNALLPEDKAIAEDKGWSLTLS